MHRSVSFVLQDVEATILKAAQANLVTAAAQHVLEACKQAGKQPPEQVCSCNLHVIDTGTWHL